MPCQNFEELNNQRILITFNFFEKSIIDVLVTRKENFHTIGSVWHGVVSWWTGGVLLFFLS